MKILVNKKEFVDLAVNCRRTYGCHGCALNEACTSPDSLVDICEIVEDEPKEE